MAIAGSSLYANNLPNIIKHPENITIKSGKSATFKVILSDSSDISYQWRKNGLPIKGATKSSYTIKKVSSIDNQTTYSIVIIKDCKNSMSSSVAILTVK